MQIVDIYEQLKELQKNKNQLPPKVKLIPDKVIKRNKKRKIKK